MPANIITNIVIILIIAVIIGCSIFYIVREKKKGNRCIGCPYAKDCHGGCSGKEYLK